MERCNGTIPYTRKYLVRGDYHIIDSGDGLIMLDSDYQESLYLVIDSMYSYGLEPKNLRYIIHSHGHIGQVAAFRLDRP